MEQVKALNALEPFLALTKFATSPRAAADLVTQATSNPNTYVFAELLQTPQIQALAQSPEYASHLRLLEIFSYGTYETYHHQQQQQQQHPRDNDENNSASAAAADANPLPSLNDAQTLKLRQLSLLTLARTPRTGLEYGALRTALGLPDARAVEDLVISAVYADLLRAQLDPRSQTVHVSSVSPLRDLAPDSVPAILGQLRDWSGRCSDTLSDLEAQIAAIRAAAHARHAEKAAREATQARLVEDAAKNPGVDSLLMQAGAGSGGGGGGVHSRRQGNILNQALAGIRGGASAVGQRYGSKRGNVEANIGDDDYEVSSELMELDDDELDDSLGEGGGPVSGGSSGGGVGSNRGGKRTSRRKL